VDTSITSAEHDSDDQVTTDSIELVAQRHHRCRILGGRCLHALGNAVDAWLEDEDRFAMVVVLIWQAG